MCDHVFLAYFLIHCLPYDHHCIPSTWTRAPEKDLLMKDKQNGDNGPADEAHTFLTKQKPTTLPDFCK